MPHVGVMIAGAGIGAAIYAGYRWLSREIMKRAAEVQREARQRQQRTAEAPKDLGALEWDDRAGVYRPQRA